MAPFYRFFGCICLLLLLSGCGRPDADDLWADYLERLARLARADVPAVSEWQRPLWPAPRDIRLPTPEWRSGWLRYLDMVGCDLMELVADRNSGLGRVQVPVVRLDYELRFVDEAQACLQSDALPEDGDMRQWLATLREEKRAAMPVIYWNTVVGGNEIRRFLRQGEVPAKGPLLENRTASLQALESLAGTAQQLSSGDLPASAGNVPDHLQTLDLSRAGPVIDALALANRHLPRATALLRSVDTATLCPRGAASQRANYFHNVLTKVYAAKVQPWLSAAWRDSEQLEKTLAPLLEHAPEPRPSVARWQDDVFGNAGLRARMGEAIDAHTRAWQELLADCGLSPGQTH